MSEPVLRVEDVWKKFKRGERHDSLRDLLGSLLRGAMSTVRGSELTGEEFWSLRDVNFEVRPGQALGIIGANGAGKSTTLKLLTRVLRPTRGQIVTRGRLGALIEVAAGFHPDLTGRENVFLQGAIMGMPQRDIRRKFDEIVDFAGVVQFIDTPVKRYSSGMNARLGFSIAAHLDPDILIVDEVLAVGDLAFQQRAFSKLADSVKRGVPVVVVSHQLDKISQLCTEAILLVRGEIAAHGDPAQVIMKYLASGTRAGDADLATFSRFELVQPDVLKPGSVCTVWVEGAVAESWNPARFPLVIRVLDGSGTQIFATASDRLPFPLVKGENFAFGLDLEINLGAGQYLIQPLVWDTHAKEERCHGPVVKITVSASDKWHGAVNLAPVLRVGC